MAPPDGERLSAEPSRPEGAPSPPASLLYSGRRVLLTGAELTIGRGEDSDLMIGHERVSRHHARISRDENSEYSVEDLGSRHGTLVNGEPLGTEPRRLENGDAIEIGDERLRFLSGQETRMSSREQAVTAVQTVRFEGERVTIGRDEQNDVVLADPNVSRFHAEVVAADGATELRDLGSRNGTRLNGELVSRAALRADAEIGVGPYRLIFDGEVLTARSERGALRLDAVGVTVTAGEKRILHESSISLEPGELVAIIGESGAGKSTLLKALAGVTRPSAGAVTLNGEPITTRLTDVGYVPQDEIVHTLLSVREALDYAGRLRLPRDASDEDLRAAIDEVLAELALDEHSETRIGSLSGGQRKRTGVATELLGKPGVLFLDEPTTGMDPGLESKMMELFRELADNSRSLALVTHATRNLALCDRVVVMARGGYTVFDGSPAEALDFFDVENYDAIYGALEEQPAEHWSARRKGDGAERPAGPGRPADHAQSSDRGLLSQSAVLTGRYLKLLVRDRRNLALLVGQAPILALAGIGLFHSGIFDLPGGDPATAIQLLFLAVIVVIWLGAIDAAREIVKERAVFERESAVGMRLGAYMVSKVTVLFGLVAVQTILYAGLLFAFRPLDESVGTWLAVFALLLVTGFASVAMGLLVSAAVTSEDQAMSIIPLAVIPQLLFAGTIVPVARMAEPAHTLANAIFARWSLASVGHAIDMNARIAADPTFRGVSQYGKDFFDVAVRTGLLIEAGFMVAFLAGVALLLRRRTT
jgi:ABC-type multidrug transport system ATPase subunit/ABC-type multidrug transport system permease subunit